MAEKDIQLNIRLSSKERDLIQQKMKIFGTENMSAFIRKMAIDGMVIKLDLPEIKDLLHHLRRANANINQIAKRLHQTGHVYDTDIEEIAGYQKQMTEDLREVLTRLSKLN